jgi:hypothetical protein
VEAAIAQIVTVMVRTMTATFTSTQESKKAPDEHRQRPDNVTPKRRESATWVPSPFLFGFIRTRTEHQRHRLHDRAHLVGCGWYWVPRR